MRGFAYTPSTRSLSVQIGHDRHSRSGLMWGFTDVASALPIGAGTHLSQCCQHVSKSCIKCSRAKWYIEQIYQPFWWASGP